jgi:tetratricopeptide (TPR) repeat protein
MAEDPTLFDSPDDFSPERISFDGGITLKVLQTLRGGTGIVHIGTLRDDNKTLVAAKTLQKRFLVNPAVRGAYQRELSIWAKIGAVPFVVPLMGVWQAKGQPYAVSIAAVDATGRPQTVRTALERQPDGLAPPEILKFAFCLAVGMQRAADRVPGLVHGDLKPENLLLLHDVLHIADFGLARAASVAASSAPPAGTTAYLSPESFVPNAVWAGSRDVYAFGCLLQEMLTGSAPFGVDNDTGVMRERHERGAPPITVGPGEDRDLAMALAALARHCLARDPQERPVDFNVLRAMLDQLADQFAPEELNGLRLMAADPFAGMWDILTLTQRAAALLEAELPAEALELLSAIPTAERTGELALLTGTALSLSNRDEEALEFFERCLADESSTEHRDRCLSEKGLSLRRLGRYDEALELYEGMLASAGSYTLKGATANYAGTLLDAGRPKEALAVIDRLAHDNLRDAKVWALKGQVEQKLETVDAAITSFEHALSLDPELLQARLQLVDLLVMHRLDLEGAFTHLDLAFDLGSHSRGLISRLLAAAALLGRSQVATGLMEGLKNLEDELGEAINKEAMDLISKWGKALLAVQPAAPPKHASAAISQASAPPKNLVFETALKVNEGSALPLISCRAFPLLSMFMADYYDDLNSDGLPERFASALRQLSLVALPTMLSEFRSLELCRLPFRFVRCTHCGTTIFSNRSGDEPLLCRICDKRGPLVVASTVPVELVTACEAAADLKRIDLKGQTLFLFVWPFESAHRAEAERVLGSIGFSNVKSDLPLRMATILAKRTGLDVNLERTIATRMVVTDTIESYGGTPWPVQRALAALHLKLGDFPSLSMNFSSAQSQLVGEGNLEAIVASIIATDGPMPTDPRALGSLIDCYTHLKWMEKAERCVAFSLQISQNDDPRLRAARGRYLISIGKLDDAIANLVPAIEDDPLDVSLRMSMINALLRSGQKQRADEEMRRARAIGLNLGF